MLLVNSLNKQKFVNKHAGRIFRAGVMVFKVTFNNISVISWRSVLLVGETGENHRPVASHWHTVSHSVVSSTLLLSRVRTHSVSTWWWVLIAEVFVNLTTIRSRPRRPSESLEDYGHQTAMVTSDADIFIALSVVDYCDRKNS